METGSVTAAAARLHCTQPAASVALSKFEQASGLALFDRVRGRFVPTAEGEALYVEVERGLHGIGRISNKIDELRHGRVGSLTIATDGAITLLAQVVAAFQERHADVTLDLFHRPSKEIVNWTSGRQLDVGVVEGITNFPGVAFEPFVQPCVCLVPADHPLATADVVTPPDLASQTLIGIGEHHSIDTQLTALLAAVSVRPGARINAEYFETCKQLVRRGVGLTIIGVASHEADLGDGVVAVPFDPQIQYEMSIVTPSRPGPSALARLFVDDLRAVLDPVRID
jgi:DNA-binding transcriptional LysR family regulator